MRALSLAILLIGLFACTSLTVKAQSYVVKLHATDSSDLSAAGIRAETKFDTQQDALDFIQSLVPSMQSKGLLAASLDSVASIGDELHAYLYAGKVYKWARVDMKRLPVAMQIHIPLLQRDLEGLVTAKQLSNVAERLIVYAENSGYPFARVWLDEIKDSMGTVYGSLRMDQGKYCTIDSIEIGGEVKISRSYLYQYLDLKKGEPYNEKKLRTISPRLKELAFLEEAQPWYVSFRSTETRLHIELKEKKANQLNALIGLLPNSVETGKFMLTVDALFAFQNILGLGENLAVSYQNLQYKSPRLKADVTFPYLLRTPLGIEGHFDLFRKDTSFRRTSLQLGLRYQLNATDYVRAYYLNQSNRLITVDTTYVRAQKKLPDNADVASNGGGLELGLNRTDYRIAPRKGWQLRASVTAARRVVTKSDAVLQISDGTGFDFGSLYDSLERRPYQYVFNGDAAGYIPLFKKATLKIAYAGGWVPGERLFRNELFQIGGFKLMRGFDEQSIYTSQYHIATAEFRLMLDKNSYVYLFSDNGWIESKFNGFSNAQFYNGFGLGTTLQTKNGVFSISYALGRNDANPVQFRQSKVHFGYVAFF